MLEPTKVRAISLDLDDTLWPVWPTIRRAEQALHDWLAAHAPATARLFADTTALRAVREEIERLRPDLRSDLSALRRESIRLALQRAGDAPGLAEPAFEVFFEHRQRVELFDDALPCLRKLAARYPLISLSNGNADVQRVGIGGFFRAAISAASFGAAKPDARIFEAAAQAAGVAVHEVLHVGDDAALDFMGARRCGMQAVWVNRDARPWPQADAAHAPAPQSVVTDLHQLCERLGLS
ncbi:MAG: HAD family hydrolase [Betaproteobacteria bacterium]|jgi:FMN hydrolase / 5-amino-6-(5-phospho-D-ribitylamino)uracil phosphatase|nr:HAD family hydrolase [Betaproteobacteria bacterium]